MDRIVINRSYLVILYSRVSSQMNIYLVFQYRIRYILLLLMLIDIRSTGGECVEKSISLVRGVYKHFSASLKFCELFLLTEIFCLFCL